MSVDRIYCTSNYEPLRILKSSLRNIPISAFVMIIYELFSIPNKSLSFKGWFLGKNFRGNRSLPENQNLQCRLTRIFWHIFAVSRQLYFRGSMCPLKQKNYKKFARQIFYFILASCLQSFSSPKFSFLELYTFLNFHFFPNLSCLANAGQVAYLVCNRRTISTLVSKRIMDGFSIR